MRSLVQKKYDFWYEVDFLGRININCIHFYDNVKKIGNPLIMRIPNVFLIGRSD